MRCFLGMSLPLEIRDRLSEVLSMGDKPKMIRRVSEERWHLTLAFLGEVDPEHIPKIIQRLSIFNRSPGTIELTKLETFPQGKPRLLVASGIAEPTHEWDAFIKGIRSEAASLASNMDTKPWMVHITLGRAGRDEVLPAWEKSIGSRIWKPDGFTLVQSKLGNDAGSGYKNLHDFRFKD